MIEVPRLSIRAVRERLADVVDEAERDRPTIILRRGRPVAAVVPLEVLQRFAELEEREINRIIDERAQAHTANSANPVPLEDVLRETVSRER
ncbi:type II toxin-antitoxin system Phd/YefM family antitoxin [Kineosporia rhizophila]|uniref:type II toxin-antitoxin system Phd/YefM family antitoxin n=1 Tax=Kineosporia rhizophila TaxID=84633 RepID=UPI001E4BACA5|nr:type II toxin-antitoxin system prevent-host-death family antitoxin [Kineosporia rhizophila]MCE0534995.1 type II toxin-antitoxin system Phd/YefM family antitoxin [Kineosporia rhizophila]